MAFQTVVNANPAPGIEGGWASVNDHFSMQTPSNGDPALPNYPAWIVGAGGATIGRFVFADPVSGTATSTAPTAATFRVGFAHRYHPTIITPFLGSSSVTLYQGQEIDILDSGDVWARFAAGAAFGAKVFASYADGSAIAGVAGTPPTATGVTATTTSGSAALTNVAGGTLVVGQPISGTGIPAGTRVIAVSGSGATMSANATASAAGVAITQTTAVETRWWVHSVAAPGDIAKIDTRQ